MRLVTDTEIKDIERAIEIFSELGLAKTKNINAIRKLKLVVYKSKNRKVSK